MIFSLFRKFKHDVFHKLISFSNSDFFFGEFDCLFLVPVPARASAHARYVLAYVGSNFPAGKYFK